MSTSILPPVVHYICSKKCGEIKMTPDAVNFQLVCEFCKEIFVELLEFIMHIKTQKCLYRGGHSRDSPTQQQNKMQIKKPQQRQQEVSAEYTTVKQLLEEADMTDEQNGNVIMNNLTEHLEVQKAIIEKDPLEFPMMSIKKESPMHNFNDKTEFECASTDQAESVAWPMEMDAIGAVKRKYEENTSWSRADEEFLLHLWSLRLEELRKASDNTHVFHEIAEELQKRECAVDHTEVRIKMQDLTAKYKWEKSKIEQSIDHTSEWPLYSKMNNLLGMSKKYSLESYMEDSISSSECNNSRADPNNSDEDQEESFYFEDEDENGKLRELLEEFNLDQTFKSFSDCGFTYERLQFINTEDLQQIFPGRANIGLRAELREKTFSWKAENFVNKPLTSPITTNKLIDSQENERSLTPSTCSSSTNIGSVLDILKTSRIGNALLKVYAEKKCLCHFDRKRLLNVITEYFYDTKQKKYTIPRPSKMESIAEEIVEIFPTESKDIYYISRKESKKPNPNGILFNRFNNLNRKRHKPREFKDETFEAEPTKVMPEPDTLSMQKKMKLMTGDENDSMRIWMSTYKYRTSVSQTAAGLSGILEEWPFYKPVSGTKYIEYDYYRMYPNTKYHMKNKWPLMKEKLHKIYETHIKDKYYAELFHSLKNSNTDENSTDCIFIMLLNTILKPTFRHVTKVDGKSKITKVTITDAIQSSIVHIKSRNDLQRVRMEKLKKSIERKITLPPYLIVVGSEIKLLKEFYISFDKYLLEFGNFITALDMCFKIFNVFHLNYPTESNLIWYFLQKQIYEISTPQDVKSSALTEFLSNFREF